ncbi:winged helix-turn-helix transcriptional regulator [bacterium]|jgi:Transcriptional regulatory protein, C terminal|nr:winged helix-turn-helix transcriptional regulator [bacterium]
MDADTARRLNVLAGQLAEALMTAAICAREIQAVARTEIAEAELGHRPDGFVPRPLGPVERPLLDESTLSVIWKGKSLHLGNTLAFRLLERLARCPNQYVTHLDLLRDVWEDELLATATIRSLVRQLRCKLRGAGWVDLATAIRGHNGHYVLSL